MNENNYLYDWIFRYNEYTKNWCAVGRSNYGDLFSKEDSNRVLKSSSIETLIEVINKIEGDINNIDSILNK
jgi:hypothetical protein